MAQSPLPRISEVKGNKYSSIYGKLTYGEWYLWGRIQVLELLGWVNARPMGKCNPSTYSADVVLMASVWEKVDTKIR